MENITPVSKYAIDSILKGIENLDEYEAEYFYQKLAEQSHDHEIEAFLKGAKLNGKYNLERCLL